MGRDAGLNSAINRPRVVVSENSCHDLPAATEDFAWRMNILRAFLGIRDDGDEIASRNFNSICFPGCAVVQPPRVHVALCFADYFPVAFEAKVSPIAINIAYCVCTEGEFPAVFSQYMEDAGMFSCRTH